MTRARVVKPPSFEGYSTTEVPFVGPQPTDWLLLGEAPGREEDEFGQPFIGQAGTVLTGCCTEAGLPRDRCRIGNTVPRRPPGNRKPTAREIKFYREALLAEIAATHPKVIVALGDIPLKTLTGLSGITKRRGMEITTDEGWIVLPTFHPAYALPNRNPQARKWIVADLRKARRLAGEGPIGQEPTVQIIGSYAQLPMIPSGSVIAYDVETTGLDPLDSEKRMVGVGISWSDDIGYYILPDAWVALRPILNGAARLVAHNGMFDNRWLRRYNFNPTQTFDTLLAAYLLDDTRPTYKLERLAVELLDIPPYHAATEDALDHGKADELVPEVLGGRCARDACYTLRLYRLLRAQIVADPKLVAAFKYLMMPGARLAESMMDAGLPLDMALIDERIEACLVQRAVRVSFMRGIANSETFNPGSPQQVGKALSDVIGLPMVERTKTGRVATGEAVLAHFTDQPFITALQDYRKTTKYLTSYYEKWKARSRNGRVYGSVWIARSDVGSDKMHGTRTGRFSGDLQQTPKQFDDTPAIFRVKDVVLARPGRTLVEVDLSQIELRVMAWFGPERAMLKAYQEGKDLHFEFALGVNRDAAIQTASMYLMRAGLSTNRGGVALLRQLFSETSGGEEITRCQEIIRLVDQARQEQASGGGKWACSNQSDVRRIESNVEGRSISLLGAEAQARVVRLVREYSESSGPSSGRESAQQSPLQYSDAVSLLSSCRASTLAEYPAWRSLRSRAKSALFGYLYGMGAAGFQEYALTTYGLTFILDEAEHMRQSFFEKYPDLPKYYRRCEREVRRTKAIHTPFGRIRRLPDVDSPLPERRSHAMRQAINTPIQGTASDLNLLVAIEAQKFAPTDTQLLMLFHDASFWETDTTAAEPFARQVVEFVRRRLVPIVRARFGVTITVPLDADAKIGQRWGDMKDLTIKPEERKLQL